ncbi:IS630 family transposase [Streptomyces sp. M92]|nr:IS630 family transposase [Streptomyces sp. M92]WCN07205.1 IS630 family transposase [Streptomyces sp. M92]
METAERFGAGATNAEVAKDLPVSVRSVQRWRRAGREAGTDGLRSVGPVSLPKLSEVLFAVLEQELDKGPVAHGWPDQTWTLARIKTLIGRRFHTSFTLPGIAQTLRRHGWSHQVPARRATERDGVAVGGWVKETFRHVEAPRRRSTPTLSLRTRPAGFSMTPPTARTRSRCGDIPVDTVRGRSQSRIPIAALACYKPGARSRLVYRPTVHPDHKAGGRRSFAWTHYRNLLIAAHQRLGRPIVLVWDNCNVHRDRRLRAFIDAQDWVTVYHLPPYAPQRSPADGIRSLLRRRCQANTGFTDLAHLMRALRQGLRQVQYRPDLIDGCLAGTGLALTRPRLQGGAHT